MFCIISCSDCRDCGEEEDCPSSSPQEEVCAGWRCHNGFCLAASLRCDGVVHCSDSSDEADCPGCSPHQFRCLRDGRCVEAGRVCDQHLDCWDGSDETNCPYRRSLCWPDGFRCVSGLCVGLSARCDGAWDCPHGEDEQQCGAGCGVEQWRCRDGGCIGRPGLCDNRTDCGDGSDEWPHCHCHSRGLASCPLSGQCLPFHSLCDGKEDCEDGSDELNCTSKLASTTLGETQTTTSSYEEVEKVTTFPSDSYESPEKYPDFPTEMVPAHSNKFLGFKPLSLTNNTRKPQKSEASLAEERAGPEVEPAEAPVLSPVRVRVYPARQTVMAGQDAVVQCRDEGDLRTRVGWARAGAGQAGQLPVNSRQERGRLELYGVREEEGGQYICSSLSQGHSPGGSQAATIQVLTAVP